MRLTIMIVAILALGLSACGRRGPLEPPPGAKSQEKTNQEKTTTGSEVETEGATPQGGFIPSPTPTPKSKQNRGYTIPKQPFILDPLL